MQLELNVPLTFEFHKEGMYWVGKCVELDILTAHKSRSVVQEDLESICKVQAQFARVHGVMHQLFRKPSPQDSSHA